jgi:hypothetical protein
MSSDKAEDRELRGRVAIKAIRKDLMDQPRLRTFRREVHLAKQVFPGGQAGREAPRTRHGRNGLRVHVITNRKSAGKFLLIFSDLFPHLLRPRGLERISRLRLSKATRRFGAPSHRRGRVCQLVLVLPGAGKRMVFIGVAP